MGPPAPLPCASCGRPLTLARAHELGATPSERFERALTFAQEHDIDLASAYSVLLGLVPLSAAARLPIEPAEPAKRDGAETSAAPAGELSHDPAFGPAVSRGRLTVRQAWERGDRVAYATRIASRHRLPMKLAFQVTDNVMTLRGALEQRRLAEERGGNEGEKVEPAPTRSAAPLGARPSMWALAVAGALLALVSLRPEPQPLLGTAEITRQDVGLAEVVTDSRRRVVEVLGPTPASVLSAFCATGRDAGRYEAVDIAPSPLDPGRARIGLLRDPSNPEGVLAITIRIDPERQLWVTGDGRTPVEVRRAPAGAERAVLAR